MNNIVFFKLCFNFHMIIDIVIQIATSVCSLFLVFALLNCNWMLFVCSNLTETWSPQMCFWMRMTGRFWWTWALWTVPGSRYGRRVYKEWLIFYSFKRWHWCWWSNTKSQISPVESWGWPHLCRVQGHHHSLWISFFYFFIINFEH